MSPTFFNSLLISAGLAWIALVAQAHASDKPNPAETKRPVISLSDFTSAEDSCTGDESWSFSPAIAKDWRDEFGDLLSGKLAAVRAFSEGLALRRFARDPEARLFAEYWIARSLLAAKMPHISYAGFTTIAAQPMGARTAGIQAAAIECLGFIHRRYPSMVLPAAVTARLGDYLLEPHLKDAAHRRPLLEYSLLAYHHALGDQDAQASQRFMKLLADQPAFEPFSKGMDAARRGDHSGTVAALEKYFEQNPPASFRPYHDHARLVLARAYYTMSNFEKAGFHLHKISKNSNELAKGLSEMAWAQLMDEKYSEAVGSAISLQAGGLRHTFAPESPMVMAMAMNEICQFPEALKAISTYKRSYEKPFRWLDGWMADGGKKALYPYAVKFLRKQQLEPSNPVPDRLGTEWVRTPLFISHQDEINLLFDERESTAALSKAGAREQKKLGMEIRKLAGELKSRIKQARTKMKPGDTLPQLIQDDLQKLKRQVTWYRRMRNAAPVWRTVLANYQRTAPGLEKRLVARINEDLQGRSRRMHQQLMEIAENNQLIEVEIFNGASQDIVWQNAHPDYQKVAKNFKDASKPNAAEVWDWGKTSAGNEENAEIWEDELGSFRADLFDNCSSKDKYLALKKKGIS